MAIPGKRVAVPAKGGPQGKPSRDEDVLSKKRKRKEEDEEEKEEAEEDEEDEDEEEEEEDGDDEEDEDEEDEDDEEEDDEDEDDEEEDVEVDDEELAEIDEGETEETEEEDDDADLDDDDEEDEDFDDEDDEDEDDEDEEEEEDDDEDDEEFDEEEDEEKGTRGRRSKLAAKKGAKKKDTEEGRAPPKAGIAAGVKDATVKIKPVSSSSSAKRAGRAGSSRGEPPGASRRTQLKGSDKLKLVVMLICVVLTLACIGVGLLIVYKRMNLPEKPKVDLNEPVTTDLRKNFNGRVEYGDQIAAQAKELLAKEDYIGATDKYNAAVRVWEGVIKQIDELRKKPEYRGDDFGGYDKNAMAIGRKMSDARQAILDMELQAARQRVENEKKAAPSPAPKTEQKTEPKAGEIYDPDREEQLKRKAAKEAAKKAAEAKAALEKAPETKAEEPKKETQPAPAKPEEKKEEAKAEAAPEAAPAAKPETPAQ